jgi:hypothetical protein
MQDIAAFVKSYLAEKVPGIHAAVVMPREGHTFECVDIFFGPIQLAYFKKVVLPSFKHYAFESPGRVQELKYSAISQHSMTVMRVQFGWKKPCAKRDAQEITFGKFEQLNLISMDVEDMTEIANLMVGETEEVKNVRK